MMPEFQVVLTVPGVFHDITLRDARTQRERRVIDFRQPKRSKLMRCLRRWLGFKDPDPIKQVEQALRVVNSSNIVVLADFSIEAVTHLDGRDVLCIQRDGPQVYDPWMLSGNNPTKSTYVYIEPPDTTYALQRVLKVMRDAMRGTAYNAHGDDAFIAGVRPYSQGLPSALKNTAE